MKDRVEFDDVFFRANEQTEILLVAYEAIEMVDEQCIARWCRENGFRENAFRIESRLDSSAGRGDFLLKPELLKLLMKINILGGSDGDES